jgi:uncharacterized protein YdeI (BOF family)
MKSAIKAAVVALGLASGAAFAHQETNVDVNGVLQAQFGVNNFALMEVGVIQSNNLHADTNVFASGNLVQLQAGNANFQYMDIGSVKTTKPFVLTTHVKANNVFQVQGGNGNVQAVRIGTIY